MEKDDIEVCPVCGSDNIFMRENDKRDRERLKEIFMCGNCHADWEIIWTNPYINEIWVIDPEKSTEDFVNYKPYKGE